MFAAVEHIQVYNIPHIYRTNKYNRHIYPPDYIQYISSKGHFRVYDHHMYDGIRACAILCTYTPIPMYSFSAGHGDSMHHPYIHMLPVMVENILIYIRDS